MSLLLSLSRLSFTQFNRSIQQCLIAVFFIGLIPSAQSAAPWVDANDDFLRTSIEVLADANVITMPINTYPLPWHDIRRDLLAVDERQLTPATKMALYVVRQAISHSMGWSHEVIAYTGTDTFDTQSFGRRMDSQSGVSVANEYLGSDWAVGVTINVKDNPYDPSEDNQKITLDGSYAAKRLGNWWLSVDQMSQYWGPANTNSIIMSNNARPYPAMRLTRESAVPFETQWLSWLGPWSVTTYLGQQESSNILPDIKLWGMRVNFRPLPSLEIGLSRASQWGGQGRDESFQTFIDMLVGLDNGQDGRTGDKEAGNQLAGYDIRWNFTLAGQSMALYGEYIGEDEANKQPSHFFYLSGIETTFNYQQQLAQLFLEYTDTTVDCSWEGSGRIDTYNCGYNNGVMKEGYRRYGRSMGSTYDNDTIAYTLGAKVIGNASQWFSHLSHIRLNIDNRGFHPLAPQAEERLQWDLGYQQTVYKGTMLVEGRLMDRQFADGSDEVDAMLRASWQYQW